MNPGCKSAARLRPGVLFISMALALVYQGAVAQEPASAFPSKPMKIVVPSEPGGGSDLTARAFAVKLTEGLGKGVVVENRSGASGAIGSSYVAKSPADGYTILFAGPPFVVLPAQVKDASYDPVADFAPVVHLTRTPYVIFSSVSFPVTSIREYAAYAKANPGATNVGVGAPGSFTHLMGAWLDSLLGVKVTYIPFKGTGPMLQEVMAGRLNVSYGNPIAILPAVKTGKVRLLAVTTKQRAKVLPDVPTVAEQGAPSYDLSTWQTILAPARTPVGIVSKLNASFNTVLKQPAIADKLAEDGSETVGGTPEQLRTLIVSETKRWADLIPTIGDMK